MIGIQILSIAFALGALFFTYTHFRRKDFGKAELIGWSIVWVAFIGVAIFAKQVSPYVQMVGFTRLMDFVVVVAFVIVFGLLLHNYFVVHRLERRIEKLVRDLALKDLENYDTSHTTRMQKH